MRSALDSGKNSVKVMEEKSLGSFFGEYLAGAFLAFGFSVIAREAFVAYFAWSGAVIEVFGRDLLGLATILHITGGFLGGYLVSRRRETDTVRVGITTGLFAYPLEFIYDMLFQGQFVNGIWMAGSYVVGGALGAIYGNYRKWGSIRSPRLVVEEEALTPAPSQPASVGRVARLIELTEEVIMSKGYEYTPVEPWEFIDYLSGPTPTGDQTTIEEILEKRYLTIHEVVETSELKKMGIPLDESTVMEHFPEVFAAHMVAFEMEISIAQDEGSDAWVEERLRLVNDWLEDDLTPEKFRGNLVALKNKFTEKR